jgi:tetratricopeptide (TPR) repeat protein
VPEAIDTGLLKLVRDARRHLIPIGKDSDQWLDRLEERHDELHALMEILLASDPPAASEAGATLWRFWWLRGHMAEGRAFLERAGTIQGTDRIEVLKGLGTISFRHGELDAAERAFSERFNLLAGTDQQRDLADACADMARIALRRGDIAKVRSYAEEGYVAARNVGPEAILMPLHMRAAAARMEGRYEEARALYLESRDLNERFGKGGNVAGEDHNLMYVALHSGDRAEAEKRFRSSSEWIFAHEDAYLRPYAFLDSGVLAIHDGDLERGARLVARAERIFQESGSIPDPDDRVELDDSIARLRKELGSRFEGAWAEGREMSLGEAQALARS